MKNVGVLGCGSIGSVVARCLANGEVKGAALAGVAVRPGGTASIGPTVELAELIERSDLIVEAAGQTALAEHGATILEAGCDLLAVSIGALADEATFETITSAGPGSLHVCTGAIGGVDMVRAVGELGEIRSAKITTTKKPASLGADVDIVTTLFEGDVRELVTKFPSSTNVAATLALAVGDWDRVQGAVVADPDATLTHHVIEVDAEAGQYRFEMAHEPSKQNPRSSAVVPWAVVRSVRDLCEPGRRFV